MSPPSENKIHNLLGFRTAPGRSRVTNSIAVLLELYPKVECRPEQSPQEAAQEAAIRLLLKPEQVKSIVAALQITLVEATSRNEGPRTNH